MSEPEIIREKARLMSDASIQGEIERIYSAIMVASRPRDIERYERRVAIFQEEQARRKNLNTPKP